MKALRITTLTAVLMLAAGAAFADETAVRGEPVPAAPSSPAAPSGPAAPSSPRAPRLIPAQDSSAGPLLRMAGLTLGIIAIGGAITGYARQRTRRRAGTAGAIEILDVRSIGPRHRVAVIEVGPRRVLVGLGHDSISTLLDLSEGAEFTQALGQELPDAHESTPLVGRFEGLDG